MKKLPPTGVKGFEAPADLGQANQTTAKPKVEGKQAGKARIRSNQPVHDVHDTEQVPFEKRPIARFVAEVLEARGALTYGTDTSFLPFLAPSSSGGESGVHASGFMRLGFTKQQALETEAALRELISA
jgi:hypothetical protein